MTDLQQLNQADEQQFVKICGPFFEHSPWIARQAYAARPFSSLDHLHQILCDIVRNADVDAKLMLIRAHPDLVGRLAREGRLTVQSTTEQKAAGLTQLTSTEAEQFESYNAAYRQRFGFPFVICARENKKDAILAAFPQRLKNARDHEIQTALAEIYKIARLRLLNAISES